MSSLKDLILDTDTIEPETIRQVFPMLTDSDIEKIQVVRTIVHTKFFFEDMYVFEDAVLVLNNEQPDFTYLQGTTPEQIWYAVTLVSEKLRPGVEYSWEVQAYAKWMFNEAGVYIYPEVFTDLANPYLAKAKELAEKNEFGEDSVELIQASKYKTIQFYIEKMSKQNQAEWR